MLFLTNDVYTVLIVFCDREYVVDLVGEPGNIHGPDSSINGGFLSPMPSLLQISHLKEFQHPYKDSGQNAQSNSSRVSPENLQHTGVFLLDLNYKVNYIRKKGKKKF